MNNSNLAIILVVAIVALLAGAFIGVTYQLTQQKAQPASSGNISNVVRILSSKAIGKVTAIQGRNITLTFSGQKVTIPILQNANIFLMVANTQKTAGAPALTSKKSDFSIIKVGDNVNISIRISSTGTAEGLAVLVYPATAPATAINK